MKTVIKAEIVAHSINEQGDELISVLVTLPRIILSEMNTHRMLSKNTSSSRAIPFKKMVESIQNDPFIPIAWQEDHKGMQGTKYLDPVFAKQAEQEWLIARDYALSIAGQMNSSTHVTKQLCNRLLEPFMWTTMLITGPKSGWDNFFHLRCPQYEYITKKDIFYFKSKKDWTEKFYESKIVSNTFATIEDINTYSWLNKNKGHAEIHMMALAECIWDAYNESTPKVLKGGEWHIPFEDKMDISSEEYINITGKVILKTEDLIKIKVKSSVAMAARTSYTVVGEEKGLDYEALIGLHDRLLAQDPPHSSPMEHACQAVTDEEYNNSFKGQEKGWFRNYKGFKSYRQVIEESK